MLLFLWRLADLPLRVGDAPANKRDDDDVLFSDDFVSNGGSTVCECRVARDIGFGDRESACGTSSMVVVDRTITRKLMAESTIAILIAARLVAENLLQASKSCCHL